MEYIVVLILILLFLTGHPEPLGQTELPPGEEEDMSPVVGLLMYDDFMEDGDLDIF